MRTLIACLAALFLSGLLAVPSSSAGPVGDLLGSVDPVGDVWRSAIALADSVPVVDGLTDGVTDLCYSEESGAAPSSANDWVQTDDQPPTQYGWKAWVADPADPSVGQWWFFGLCDVGSPGLGLGEAGIIHH